MTIDPPKRTRRDDILRIICEYAQDNNGLTPTTRQLAKFAGLSQTRIAALLQALSEEGRITFVNRYAYRVERSTWDAPEDVEL